MSVGGIGMGEDMSQSKQHRVADVLRTEVGPNTVMWEANVNGVPVAFVTQDHNVQVHAVGVITDTQIGARLVDGNGNVLAEQLRERQ